ncbi:phospholipase A and acyltransferase 1-like [Brienomyrus brachyistius]|uniref:phospholipase A and acyltransferase 1-like n=1 Tax=Brienomyrus brachyistius TaxID=42636 RepID=UPI0020B24CF2|nr:phospholipase A and acyltransferase 1-like [Brienomyrus brachyistius]XP_048874215.1 phospholipase A and acyltransferase 1-like [Brienomyrus brachyistius]XP_048874216.1 phospholipase A and acyltransferase 1-like [Brienomyrus brachyistius]
MDFKQQVSEVVSTAQFGDLIEFSYPIGYSHWGIYDEDGYIIHFAVADEGELKKRLRQSLQTVFPVCGDLLLGETQIRRQLLSEVNVPTGAQVIISNNRHARTASPIAEMRQRRDALLHKELNYNLFTLNCEHFATFIRYGQAVCNQIPGKSKNIECESATKVFQDIVREVWP